MTSVLDLFGATPLSGMEKVCRSLRDSLGINPVQGGDRSQVEEWEKCKGDTTYWIDAYCKTYDPRTPGKGLAFKLWPKQVEFIRWIDRLKAEANANFSLGGSGVQVQALCEKSRDVGVSFLCAAYVLHDFLFVPGFKAGFGSRKLEYVDKLNDPDSILEKIRFMIRKLPAWQLPSGWKFGKHDTYCNLVNPANGASITGEGGDSIGRGGRTGIYVVDEAAFLERPHLVDAALIANAALRIDVSTPNGAGNPFSQKRHSLPADKVFTLHWRDDPRKDEAWAIATKLAKGATCFASEYDIDYSASVEGITIPGAWVRAAVNLKLPPRRVNGAEVGWETLPAVAGLDVGEEGNDLSVFIARHGPLIRMPVSWGKSLTTNTAWRARDEAVKAGAVQLLFDPIGVGAGAKGTLLTAMQEDAEERGERPSYIRKIRVPFDLVPVNVGVPPSDETLWGDGQTSREKFFNLKAELWWRLRVRFEKTFEFVTQGIIHPAEEMISIPDHPQLIQELSYPLHYRGENGRIRIESKADLKRRGLKSPDFAEALVLSEAATVVKKKEFFIR